MRILFTGGGTLGPVMPLVAVWQELRQKQDTVESLWISTRKGQENYYLQKLHIPVKPIFSGKFRRYFSLKNIFTPLVVFIGFIQAFFILKKFRPQIVVAAGGFVSVPVVWAAKFLKIPSIVHQQDIRPGLANKLCAPAARVMTVAFEKSLKDFPQKNPILIGNPVRQEIVKGKKQDGQDLFRFNNSLPMVLVLGGGTGARAINTLVTDSLEYLVSFCNVVHLTGHDKMDRYAKHENYRHYDFLEDEMKDALAAADLVVCRGGLSTLTEITVLQKPSIIIPIPESHQIENAEFFVKNNAALMLRQTSLDAKKFALAVKDVLEDASRINNIKRNLEKLAMPNAARNFVAIIEKYKK